MSFLYAHDNKLIIEWNFISFEISNNNNNKVCMNKPKKSNVFEKKLNSIEKN